MMTEQIKKTIKKMIKGKVFLNEPMKKHTSLCIGGPADILIIPQDKNDIINIITLAKEKDIQTIVIGNGTKLLVSDEGVNGIVIKLSGCFDDVSISGTKVEVGAGYSLARLSRSVANQCLSGLEFAVDIPGTVGGGVAMNAGAFGSTLSDVVTYVLSMSTEGILKKNQKDDMQFGLRKSIFQHNNEIILSAEINLRNNDKYIIKEKMNEYTKKRNNSQPLNLPNAGCIFKNPLKIAAGKLIDMAGLKGMHIGDAKISEKHANFIVNMGNASAKDVFLLMNYVQEKIFEEYNIQLEPELKIIGHFSK